MGAATGAGVGATGVGAGAGAGVGTGAGAGVAAGGTAGFYGTKGHIRLGKHTAIDVPLTLTASFVIIHTRKSDSDSPNSDTFCSSRNTLPAKMIFCRSTIMSSFLL